MTADDPTSTAAEAAVRARLAEARHTDPVPDDVVARLDAVLADLTADRREQDATPGASVVPLSSAPARRRRALATGLVAAAAAVAFGVALPQVIDSTGGSDDATSASTADSGGSAFEPVKKTGLARSASAEPRSAMPISTIAATSAALPACRQHGLGLPVSISAAIRR